LNEPQGLDECSGGMVGTTGIRPQLVGEPSDERLDRIEEKTFDRSILERYKVFMKTLTITDAKKNLGHWLAAAARGEDIGIVCGANIVALRKVDVESTDYAQREYGAIPEQVAALEKATEQRYRRLKRSKKLTSISAQDLRKMLE
jgi:antitoxin (DNA-binding transcriptional repressor) of toxin-antitoxin stability system